MSLRSRLLLGLAAVAALMVVSASLVAHTTRSDLIDKVDDQLRISAANIVKGPPRGRRQLLDPALAPVNNPPVNSPGSLWVAVIQDGRILPQVGLLDSDGNDIAPKLDSQSLLDLRPFEIATIQSNYGHGRFRVIAVRHSSGVMVLLAAPLTDVESSIARLIGFELFVTSLMLFVLGLVALWVLRLGVQPIKKMTATAVAISAGDLSQRVPVAHRGTEAGELGEAFNLMLSRIQLGFDAANASEVRLRRFVADASHELRTPITTIRGYAELQRMGGLADPDELASAMSRTEQEATRMGALVEDLLLLARLDEGRPLDSAPVDLSGVLNQICDDAAISHPSYQLTRTVDPDCWVIGDENRLRQVVLNVLGNSLRHCPEGTEIYLSLAPLSEGVQVVVADRGPGMSPEMLEVAFERFSRGDQARTRVLGSTGLGLSIVQALVEAHGGSVSIASELGLGTTTSLWLPIGGKSK